MPGLRPLVLLLVCALVGCVSRSRFDDLQAERDALDARCREYAELHAAQQRTILALERDLEARDAASAR